MFLQKFTGLIRKRKNKEKSRNKNKLIVILSVVTYKVFLKQIIKN